MTEMPLYDVRVTVERIERRSVCGLKVGDWFEVTESSRMRIPAGRHICVYALQAALPLIPAEQRPLSAEDWLERENLVCCPDPDERVVMLIRVWSSWRPGMEATSTSEAAGYWPSSAAAGRSVGRELDDLTAGRL